jgi:hypothetical protein
VWRWQRTVADFIRYYTETDMRLLAELDELHGTPCGAAAKKLCERMFRIHGDHRYEGLSHISVSHLYDLRRANGYQRQRRQFEKTRPSALKPCGSTLARSARPRAICAWIRFTKGIWMASRACITSMPSMR